MIGKLDPHQAKGTGTLKDAIRIGLDEAFTALEESFHGLTDEQAWAFPIPGRHNITTLIMHSLENLDVYACQFQTGNLTVEHEERFDIWRIADGEIPAAGDDLPTCAEMLHRLEAIREAATAALDKAGQEDLTGPRQAASWWTDAGKNSADAYMRTIGHTMAHVRQIWLLRGVLGRQEGDTWPEQHWA